MIKTTFGNIDIYLFDQLLKGNYTDCEKVIDLGCGGGRNLVYFPQNDHQVFGIDKNPDAINQVRTLAGELAPGLPPENFKIARIEDMPFGNEKFDLVLCNAVLHFAENHQHFDTMLRAAWSYLKPGGYFFARLASNIGIEDQVKSLGEGRFLLPDGSERYLVDENILLGYTRTLNGELHEYIKTTNVQGLRCMTTWCMRKV